MSSSAKKRKLEDDSLALVPAKRFKTEDNSDSSLIKLSSNAQNDVNRTSKLQAPTMLLTGHQADVLSTKFSHNGDHIASGSRDKQIFLWNVYGDCSNYLVLKGHKNAVVQVEWSHDDSKLFSASSDKSLGVWDTHTGKRLLRLAEHESFVNSISVGRQDHHQLSSVGDDCVCYTWDDRSKSSSIMIQQRYQLTSCALLDERNIVFTGGIDNVINAWDLRKTSAPTWAMHGHADTLTSLRLDSEGSFLLSNAMDNTIRMWDVRAFAPQQRCTKIFTGASHGIDKTLIRANWSPDGALIAAGSADNNVYVWDTMTRAIKYCLPGHNGTVTEVDFHPKEPIIASSGADKKIYLGEIEMD